MLIINKDRTNTINTHVTVSGFVPAATGTVLTYGKTESSIETTSIAGLGSRFTLTVAPYSLTTLVLHARREHGGHQRVDREGLNGRAASTAQ